MRNGSNRYMRIIVSILFIAVAVVFVLSCNGESGGSAPSNTDSAPSDTVSTDTSCPSGALFSRAPINLDDLTSLGVLGSLIPPGHTFPTPHLYMNVLESNATVDHEATIYAPADMTLFDIIFNYTEIIGSKSDYINYTLYFSVCDDVELNFINVRSLTHPEIASAIVDGNCPSSGADRNYQECHLRVNIPISVNEVIGTAGDLEAAITGIDVGVRDYRLQTGRSSFANPDRWCDESNPQITDRCYSVCFFDYMDTDEANPYLDMFFMSDIQRTEDPVCGTVYLDVEFTAQGYWFPSTENPTTEVNSLFLGPNDYLPSKHSISTGNAIIGLASRVYSFTPKSSGLINSKFNEITDSEIYCFERLYDSLYSLVNEAPVYMDFIIVLQLSSNGNTLTIEKQTSSSCGSGPWSFTENAVNFYR